MTIVSLLSEPGGLPDRIGRYDLVRQLAVGGMAELFLARVKGLEGFEKVVVLKRILPHLAQDEDFVQMFLTEARLAATLDHPNVVHVHDIGREEGEYFFTMEYLHGENVRQLLAKLRERGQRLPLSHALSIVTDVAAGLHFAHEQVGFDGRPLGIVHRDVSPSNVIVTYSGGVKVVDFGIAKAAGTGASRLSSLKGKAAYMSPEQCKARVLDRRSDVFAIGLLLFELTTGAPAFVAGNDLAVLHRVARADVPDPQVLWPQCPEVLRQIIKRAVAVQPEDRYPTALELQLALESFAHQARVPLSNAGLGQFITDVFGDRPLPWLDGDRRAKLQVAEARDLTPATRAKPMPVLEVPRVDATVVAHAAHLDATVVTALASGPVSMPSLQVRESTARIDRAGLPSPSTEPPTRRAAYWAVAAVIVLAGGAVAWGLGAESSATEPEAAFESEPAAVVESGALGPEPDQVDRDETVGVAEQSPTVAAVDVDVDVVTTHTATGGALVVDATDSGETEAGTDSGTDVDRDVASDTSESPPASEVREDGMPPTPRRDRPSAPRTSSKAASRATAPRPTKSSDTKPAPAEGPRHSRPELPPNDDPDGLLPY